MVVLARSLPHHCRDSNCIIVELLLFLAIAAPIVLLFTDFASFSRFSSDFIPVLSSLIIVIVVVVVYNIIIFILIVGERTSLSTQVAAIVIGIRETFLHNFPFRQHKKLL